MKGKLIIIERLRNTAMGNPRFLCMVDGTVCRTIPNHCTAQVQNLDGQIVKCDIRLHRGIVSIDNVEGETR